MRFQLLYYLQTVCELLAIPYLGTYSTIYLFVSLLPNKYFHFFPFGPLN